MSRVQTVVAQLELAHHEAQKDVAEIPPEVCSALLEVKPMLERLVTEGGGLAADLHEAAHHRTFVADADQARLGILAGSIASAVAGAAVLGLGRRRTQTIGDGQGLTGGDR